MMDSLNHATEYLIDLLRAYGHRAIVVNINQQGEELHVQAKDFVRRQLAAAGIKFPYSETNKPNNRILNKHIDEDMLSVIFHEALFDLETAYVKEKCEGEPKAERYIESINSWIERKKVWLKCTFPTYSDAQLAPFFDTRPAEKEPASDGDIQEAQEVLSEIGFNSIATIEDVNKLLWELAMRRIPVTKSMRSAVETLITDARVGAWFEETAHSYNCYLHVRSMDPVFRKDELALQKMRKGFKAELSNAQNDLKQLREKVKREHGQGESSYRKLARKLINQLKTSNSRFQATYNFTQEKDIEEFLSWYKVLKRPVKKQTMKSISRAIVKGGGSEELFMKMAEEQNAKFLSVEEDDDF